MTRHGTGNQEHELRKARRRVATVERIAELLQDAHDASLGDWRMEHGHGEAPDFVAFDEQLAAAQGIVERDVQLAQQQLHSAAVELAAAREVVRQEREEEGGHA